MVVGLTGSIASGKSLVTNYLRKLNYQVIDSDVISHNILFLDDVKKEIVNAFGKEVLVDNNIDRKILGNIVFNDINKKSLLESIMLPFIVSEIKKQLSQSDEILFLDAPLLIEYNLQYLVDKIIVIKVDEDIQLKRLMERDNITKEYAIKKIESQLPSIEKLKYADFIIDNSHDINSTYNQVDKILKQLEDK